MAQTILQRMNGVAGVTNLVEVRRDDLPASGKLEVAATESTARRADQSSAPTS
jgi:hypothetical protein